MNTPDAATHQASPDGGNVMTAPPPARAAAVGQADAAPTQAVTPAPAATQQTAPSQPARPASAPVAAAIAPPTGATMDILSDVQLDVTVELGRRKLTIGELQRLAVGSVLELDTLAGDPLRIFANGRLIATGEAVVVDGHFGVRVGALSSAPPA